MRRLCFTFTNEVQGKVAKSDETRAPGLWDTTCSATSSWRIVNNWGQSAPITFHCNDYGWALTLPLPLACRESHWETVALLSAPGAEHWESLYTQIWTHTFSMLIDVYSTSVQWRNRLSRSWSLTWWFSSDVYDFDIGTHLQQCFQELVCFAIESAG